MIWLPEANVEAFCAKLMAGQREALLALESEGIVLMHTVLHIFLIITCFSASGLLNQLVQQKRWLESEKNVTAVSNVHVHALPHLLMCSTVAESKHACRRGPTDSQAGVSSG